MIRFACPWSSSIEYVRAILPYDESALRPFKTIRNAGMVFVIFLRCVTEKMGGGGLNVVC